MSEWQRDPLPLSGLCYDGDRLHVRLSGAEQAVSAAMRRIGGEIEVDGATFWERLREQRGAFFEGSGDLWRLSVPSTTRTLAVTGKQLIDWGGALRWLKTTQDAEDVFAAAGAAGGHAMRCSRRSRCASVFQALPAPLLALHQRLKKSFDPHGILNPGRLYPEF